MVSEAEDSTGLTSTLYIITLVFLGKTDIWLQLLEHFPFPFYFTVPGCRSIYIQVLPSWIVHNTYMTLMFIFHMTYRHNRYCALYYILYLLQEEAKLRNIFIYY
jgi:hypothetical protein